MRWLYSLRVAPGSRIFARARALARPGHEVSDLCTISCPGRGQRALLRERNETRAPGATGGAESGPCGRRSRVDLRKQGALDERGLGVLAQPGRVVEAHAGKAIVRRLGGRA